MQRHDNHKAHIVKFKTISEFNENKTERKIYFAVSRL